MRSALHSIRHSYLCVSERIKVGLFLSVSKLSPHSSNHWAKLTHRTVGIHSFHLRPNLQILTVYDTAQQLHKVYANKKLSCCCDSRSCGTAADRCIMDLHDYLQFQSSLLLVPVTVSVLSPSVIYSPSGERWHIRCLFVYSKKCLKKWIASSLIGTRRYNFQPLHRVGSWKLYRLVPMRELATGTDSEAERCDAQRHRRRHAVSCQ